MKDPKCCVCDCTENNACPSGCGWWGEVKVMTNANMRKPAPRPLCTACAPILIPLLERRDFKNVLVTARRIRRELREAWAL